MNCKSAAVRSLLQPDANILKLVLDADNHLTKCAFTDSTVLYSTMVLHWEGCMTCKQFQICLPLKLLILFVSTNISTCLVFIFVLILTSLSTH